MMSAPEYSLAKVADLARRYGSRRFNLFIKKFIDAFSHPCNASPERQLAMIEQPPLPCSKSPG